MVGVEDDVLQQKILIVSAGVALLLLVYACNRTNL